VDIIFAFRNKGQYPRKADVYKVKFQVIGLELYFVAISISEILHPAILLLPRGKLQFYKKSENIIDEFIESILFFFLIL